MEMNFEVNMNEYLPLRDVVFNTGNFERRIETGGETDGDPTGK